MASRSTPSKRERLEGAQVLTTKANLAPENWPGGVPEVEHAVSARRWPTDCAWWRRGGIDGMLTLRDAWEWDIAAGRLIAEKAGAVVTDRHGEEIVFNAAHPQSPGVIAASPGLHGALMTRLGR